MKIRGKIIILLVSLIIFITGAYFYISNSSGFHLFQGAEAVGGYPHQIGLIGVGIVPCFTTGYPPVCSGGVLCYLKDPASCTAYSDVSGAPAGGMGMDALFRNDALVLAGLTEGGQLIAGGMSKVFMDNGVIASAGGCAGCLAKANKIDKIKEVFDYVMASFK